MRNQLLAARKLLVFSAMLCLTSCASHGDVKKEVTQFDFSQPAAPMSVRECAVWQREKSFAATVDLHDATAFSQHISKDAVFVGGDATFTRGRQAILEEWSGFIAGEPYAIHWYPGTVQIAGDARVALSRGFYWMESGRSAPVKHYAIGHFISVWSEEADGIWRVTYDGGNTDRPISATPADVQRLRDTFPATCPIASS